jgi:hypothetical protein
MRSFDEQDLVFIIPCGKKRQIIRNSDYRGSGVAFSRVCAREVAGAMKAIQS